MVRILWTITCFYIYLFAKPSSSSTLWLWWSNDESLNMQTDEQFARSIDPILLKEELRAFYGPDGQLSILSLTLMKISFNQIYCEGPLLDTVQRAHLFNDSKYFVDMALKKDPITTLKHFYDLGTKVNERHVLEQFVLDHFDPPDTELVECYPDDWSPLPSNFYKINDFAYRRWALQLHRIWKDLCRQVRPEVRDHPELYSLIYVPHPFIIPGGRFREFYYWDSFWILKGLFFCEMYATARGMIRNLAYMVENHGFVPNGGRVYYLLRSHPPLLTPMVYEYYLATGDYDFLNELLPVLEKEYRFWIDRRSYAFTQVEHETFSVFQYRADSKAPRPESYREDAELVQNLDSDTARQIVWTNLASAAETGWDFSTRWFAHSGPYAYKMHSIRTQNIIPVDLNAFMCMNARILANLFEMTGNKEKTLQYRQRYEKAKQAMKHIHWNESDGVWYDFDLERKLHLRSYYVSNALPLYAHCYDDEDVPRRVYDYFARSGAFQFAGGVPTSFIHSEQQWDSANAWPPMVHMLIEGFRTSGDPKLAEVAKKLAMQWLHALHKTFVRTSAMYEKYNVSSGEDGAGAGSGGEYEVQTGFGWTNGVILDFLDKYGDIATSVATTSAKLSLLTLIVPVFTIIIKY